MNLGGRLKRLERSRVYRCGCAEGETKVGAFVRVPPGEAVPEDDDLPDPGCCPVCGTPFLVVVEQVVVVGPDGQPLKEQTA
jgi:hypothetical protein